MTVAAITDNYTGERLDLMQFFHGNQVVYVGWDQHMMFAAPLAFPLPPDTTFQALRDEILPGAYGQHPEFARIDWDTVQWHLNGEAFTPQLAQSLAAQGIDHKSSLRFATPGLDGIAGCGT